MPFFSGRVGRAFVPKNSPKGVHQVQFFSRVFGAASKTSQIRRADRSPRSRRSQIGVESLEGRDLMSGGITNQGGALVITAPQAANNTVIVSNDQNGNVLVNLNGNSQMFAAGTV